MCNDFTVNAMVHQKFFSAFVGRLVRLSWMRLVMGWAFSSRKYSRFHCDIQHCSIKKLQNHVTTTHIIFLSDKKYKIKLFTNRNVDSMQTFGLHRPTRFPLQPLHGSVLNRSVFQSTWLLWAHLGWTGTFTERWHFNRILELKVAVSFGLKWGKGPSKSLPAQVQKPRQVKSDQCCPPRLSEPQRNLRCSCLLISTFLVLLIGGAAMLLLSLNDHQTKTSTSWVFFRRLTHKFTRFIGKRALKGR